MGPRGTWLAGVRKVGPGVKGPAHLHALLPESFSQRLPSWGPSQQGPHLGQGGPSYLCTLDSPHLAACEGHWGWGKDLDQKWNNRAGSPMAGSTSWLAQDPARSDPASGAPQEQERPPKKAPPPNPIYHPSLTLPQAPAAHRSPSHPLLIQDGGPQGWGFSPL